MMELLPTRQAADVRAAVTDYVTTAISLAESSVKQALERFLTDPDRGMFVGPYVRSRLPFAAAQGDPWSALVHHPDTWPPYAHQAAAFERLSSNPDLPGEQDAFGMRLPQPTLVTTGTGSGKTESFLYPILDHVVRARRQGTGGIKALILYPMNALANDQAQRLAGLITHEPEYRGVTAALYTGEASHDPATRVHEDGLITAREVIRDNAPDILLTNYKMLDQLLLRAADRPLWEQSASSLRYLVLDEFHTYDGPQGTDVGMLLRRLRLVLQRISDQVHLTPVATSATLGDGGEGEAERAMLDFAQTVFGTPFPADAVVTETRRPLQDVTAHAHHVLDPLGTEDPSVLTPDEIPAKGLVDDLAAGALGAGSTVDPQTLTRKVLDILWDTDDPAASLQDIAAAQSLTDADLLLAHPTVGRLLDITAQPTLLADLAARLFPALPTETAQNATTLVLAALSHVRADLAGGAGRNAFPMFETHLWLREVSRVDRALTSAAQFLWSGDTRREEDRTTEDDGRALPAIYCRHCGRSGWGIAVANVGEQLELNPDKIRSLRAEHSTSGRFRAALYDAGAYNVDQADSSPSPDPALTRRRWLNLGSETLDLRPPDDEDADATVVPVIVRTGQDADQAAIDDTCPACDAKDGIRFVGSRVATLLSVVLSSLFGSTSLNVEEKKALVFTDSVQDAAHRAGFVEARSHSFTLRSTIRAALSEEPTGLPEIAERMMAQAVTPEQRYRLLHPTIAHADRIEPFWDPHRRRPTKTARDLVAARLQFDTGLEFGLSAQVGRTLLLSGVATAGVHATDAELDALAADALARLSQQTIGHLGDEETETRARRRWIRGILERMRGRGAISHPWLGRFRTDGGKLYRLWGGRPARDAMPAFPPGRSIPELPSIGSRPAKSGLVDAVNRRSWYADWTARVLQIGRADASALVRGVLEGLVRRELADQVDSSQGAVSYALLPDRVQASLAAVTDGSFSTLTCPTCGEIIPGMPDTLALLEGGPCTKAGCEGTLRYYRTDAQSYYRHLYDADMRRVIAREHTSLLDTETRLEYENAFKSSDTTPGAPNVLVATPTLEMGIDIGDLSTVLLASVPRTVASYLQRVGRAGRLTGNALDITFITGRGAAETLYTDPLDLIAGEVRPPGAYLSAREILHRQFLASVMDRSVEDPRIPQPTFSTSVLENTDHGTYLGGIREDLTDHGAQRVDEFLSVFAQGGHAWNALSDEAADDLRTWVTGGDAVQALHDAVGQWNAHREELRHRYLKNKERQRDLEKSQEQGDEETARALRGENDLIRAEARENIMDLSEPAMTPEEYEAERRRLRASEHRTRGELNELDNDFWIGSLERFGLLPNFTLVDDSVALDTTLVWQDEETHTWKHAAATYERGGDSALKDFAPGSHFDVEGMEYVIDAVDLGVRGDALVRTAFCPGCGASVALGASALTECPQCGAAGIADPS